MLAVNGDEAKDVMQAEGIKGFPTVRLYVKGKSVATYSGSRESASSLADFVLTELKKVVQSRLGGGSSSSSSGSSSGSGAGPVVLTDSSFKDKTSKGVWLVEYFAP